MRARFTVDEIGQCALSIVERDGVGGLTMRAVASQLKTGPMTLYNYVSGREGLEDLVVGAVIDALVLPEPTSDWRTDLRETATALWEVLRAHPNVIPLILMRRPVSVAAFAPAERMIAALSRSTLSEHDVLAAFRAILALVTGSAQAEFAGLFAGTPEQDEANAAGAARVGELARDQYPHIAKLAKVSDQSTAAADFQRGLAIFLQGLSAVEEHPGVKRVRTPPTRRGNRR